MFRLRLTALEDRLVPTNYYIDPVTGSDANPGTSEGQAWRTYTNVVYHTASTTPVGHVSLLPGDTLYLRGEGIHDFTYANGESGSVVNAGFQLFGLHGRSDAPITIRSYPGERAVLSPRLSTGTTLTAVELYGNSSWVVFDGLEVADTRGSGIRVADASEIEIRNCYIHDLDGVQADNLSGITSTSVVGLRIRHNEIHDVYQRGVVPTENNRGICVFGDGTDRVEISGNTVYETPMVDQPVHMNGIWLKHPRTILGARYEVFDNIVRNVGYGGIGSMAGGATFRNNLVLGAAEGPKFIPSGLDGTVFEHNTLVGSRFLQVTSRNVAGEPVGPFVGRGNIVVDTLGTYGGDGGLIYICGYEDATFYQQFVGSGDLTLTDNFYHSPARSPQFNLFGNGNAPQGRRYDFAGWQSAGFDARSVVADPQLDAGYVPQNPAAAGAGWLAGPPTLRAFVENYIVAQTAGAAATTLRLYRNSGLDQPLTVTLTSSDSTEATVPSSVTFPAGKNVLVVTVSAVNDGVDPRTRAVQLTATAGGMSTSDWVRVIQDSAVAPVDSSPVVPVLAPADPYGPRPNQTQNEAFVKGLYRTILGRDAEQAGLNGWVGAMGRGLTPVAAARAFWNSPENRGRQVDGYYLYFLGRLPDAQGRQGWVDALTSGALDEAAVAERFLQSPEMIARGGTTGGYVDLVYQAVLDRPADAGSRAAWVQQLDSGGTTRGQFARAVVRSDESDNRILTSFYRAYLKRVPAASELAGWRDALNRGGLPLGEVAVGFVGSAEFYDNARGAVG